MLKEIEDLCKQLATERAALRRRHEAKEKEQRELNVKYDGGLRIVQGNCSALREQILAALEHCRADFKKPKSREFHGITVGFAKERDSVTLPEPAVLVDRIEKMLPAKVAETVLDRTVRIIKDAFKKLPVADLQKLGCSVVGGGDKAVVRANDDDIETLVSKSLGGEVVS
jgi:hypothetical protein